MQHLILINVNNNMETIFYLSAVFLLWNELDWILRPIKKTNEARQFKILSGINKGKKWDEFTDEYKSVVKSKVWLFIPVIWIFIGLFTSQWVLFLSMFIFKIAIITPISKLAQHSILYTIVHWINSVIGFAVGLFVIINHYHLKINLTELFVSFIN